jgi:hypothetical protein
MLSESLPIFTGERKIEWGLVSQPVRSRDLLKERVYPFCIPQENLYSSRRL